MKDLCFVTFLCVESTGPDRAINTKQQTEKVQLLSVISLLEIIEI